MLSSSDSIPNPSSALGYVSILLDVLDEPDHPIRDTIDEDALHALADDMGANGLHQPIGVRGPSDRGRWEIIWGHRRLLAARLLGWREIAAKLHPLATDPDQARAAENLIREQLNPVEEARLCITLLKQLGSVSAVIRATRRSNTWVTARLALYEMPDDVQHAVGAKLIPVAVASALASIDHEGYRQSLIDEAARTGATEKLAAIWVAEYAKDRDRLINNLEAIPELIRRAKEAATYTDCQGCLSRVSWKVVETLRLCPACMSSIEEHTAGGGAAGSPA